METLSVPDGNAIGIASAKGVAPSDTDSVVENNDGVSEEAGDSFDEPSTKKINHVDLQKTAASDYYTNYRYSDFRNKKNSAVRRRVYHGIWGRSHR